MHPQTCRVCLMLGRNTVKYKDVPVRLRRRSHISGYDCLNLYNPDIVIGSGVVNHCRVEELNA